MFYQIVLLVVMTRAVRVQPGPTGHESDTILGKMRLELTSPNGSCSFPPQEVLENYSTESFKFLENCNKHISTSSSSKDKDTLLCMGLFDVGLRICKEGDSHTFKSLTHQIPQTAAEFQHLLTVVSNQHSDLCKALKDAVVKPQFSLTQKWNLKEAMEKSDKACSRLCYDYSDNENVFCQLILWGNRMINRTTSEDQPVSSHDSNKATGSVSMITDSQQDLSSPTGIDQPLSEPFVDADQRGGIPKAKSNDRKSTFNHVTNFTKEVIKGSGLTEHAAKQSQSLGTGNDALRDVPSSPANSGFVVNGATSADLPVEIIESGFKSKPRPVQQQSANMDSTVLGNARQNKPTNATSLGSASFGSKTVPYIKVTGQSQEDKPNTEKDKPESNMQKVTKPLSPDSEANTPSKVTTASSASAVDRDPQAVPNPMDADIELHEEVGLGEEQFGNEEQSFPSVDDEDQNIPPGPNDLNFEEPVKSETLGNENYAKDPQEEMNNGNVYVRDRFEDSEDSHFFSYFFFLTGVFIIGYLVFHNKQKILALALEGRGRRGARRRPNTANYHKLDSNLEEAVSSPCSTSSTHVIY